MGADLLITALMLDERREPDFEAAERAISALQGADVTDPDWFDGHDPEDPEGLEQIRAVLRADLQELREAIAGCREMAEMIVRGARLHLTGGMSWGDGPTEVWDVIARLRAVRGVLAAAGFEGEE
jgi:hypothetical protein